MITRLLKLALVAGAGMAAWKAMQQRQAGPFLQRALHDGVAAVEAARSAQLRGASAGLRGFAQQMEHDHAALNERLAEAAGTDVPEAGERQQAALRRIDACQGEAYDRAWLRHMARAHAQAERMFQREAEQGGEGAELASESLPKLREHARRIRELQAETDGGRQDASDAAGGGGASAATQDAIA